MKAVLLLAVVSAAVCAPAPKTQVPEEFENLQRTQSRTDDGYFVQYLSDDGALRIEKGSVVDGYLEVKGAVFKYYNNQLHTTYYTADYRGYRTKEEVSNTMEPLTNFTRMFHDEEIVLDFDKIGSKSLDSLTGGG